MSAPRPRFLLALGTATVLAGSGPSWATDIDDEPLVAPIHIDDASLPHLSLTPGDALRGSRVKALCVDAPETRQRLPSAALCDGAFARYGIPPERRFQYACRYLVPLSIGGASTERNVWPQIEAEAMLKDALDRDLTRRVCAEELSPEAAQRAVAYDWIESYRHFLIPDDPKPIVLAPSAAPQPHVRSRPDGAYVMDNDAGAGTPPMSPPGAYPDTPQSGAPNSPSGSSGQPSSNQGRQRRGQQTGPGGTGNGARPNPPSGAMVPPPRQRPAPFLRAQRQAVVHPREMARMPRPTRRDRP